MQTNLNFFFVVYYNMLFQFGNRSAAIINKVVVLFLVFVVVDGANGLNETETKSWPIRNKQTKKQQQQGQYLSSIEQVWSIKDLFKVNLLSRKQQGAKKVARVVHVNSCCFVD